MTPSSRLGIRHFIDFSTHLEEADRVGQREVTAKVRDITEAAAAAAKAAPPTPTRPALPKAPAIMTKMPTIEGIISWKKFKIKREHDLLNAKSFAESTIRYNFHSHMYCSISLGFSHTLSCSSKFCLQYHKVFNVTGESFGLVKVFMM